MFKIGDIVVKTKTTNSTRLGGKEGDIWKVNKLCTFFKENVYYPNGSMHSKQVRKATEDEIKWFEAGITNINQIPEIGASFDFVDETDSSQNCKEIIKTINTARNEIFCSTDNYDLSDYVLWLKNNNIRNYKSPSKSQHVGNEVSIDTPFEVSDLKNCKIGNLTPEDHKIIQPFLFSLGYRWKPDNEKKVIFIDKPCLYINDFYNGQLGWSITSYFDKSNKIEIKKEKILNYIKQLNTNKNEVHRQNQEITRRTINGSARILSGRQQGSTGSRPKGNIQSVKGRETYFRRSEICGSVRFG